MRRLIVCLGFLLVIAVGRAAAHAQAGENKGEAAPTAPTAPPAAEPSPEHESQLKIIREGVQDPQASPAARRRSAELLFTYDTPQAKELMRALLVLDDHPAAQLAMCEAIAAHAGQNHGAAHLHLVEPLVRLLGAEDGKLRAAAAGAFAGFAGRSSEVVNTLGTLAGNAEAPLAKRLAAIDALAENIDHREVVAQLAGLLDGETAEVRGRAMAALQPATDEPLGQDIALFKAWWGRMAQLDELSWLAYRLDSARNRTRALEDELQSYRRRADEEREALKARLGDLQREHFRALTPDQREAKLAEWLGDSVAEVKSTALVIITGRIGDEGYRPVGEVLSALLRLLEDPSASLRIESLRIIQNLQEPVAIQAVLARLQHESDSTIRQVILRALGKLGSMDALPALITEIGSDQVDAQCMREAATALGLLAGKAGKPEEMEPAVEPLKACFAAAPAGDLALRSALLKAMAGVAHPSFAEPFRAAVESGAPAILVPAVHGLTALGDKEKLPSLRTLTSHADPAVRLAALEAVGRLGREEVDAECLLARLNPNVEANETARQAAWAGYKAILASRPVVQRLAGANRLRDVPQLQLSYLLELEKGLTKGNGKDLELVRDRLAAVLMERERLPEAVVCLQGLYTSMSARGAAETFGAGLRLLEAMLKSTSDEGLTELLTQLAAAGNEAEKASLIEVVKRHLESAQAAADPQRKRQLIEHLQAVPADQLGAGWTQLLEQAAQSLEPKEQPPNPQPNQEQPPDPAPKPNP